MKTFNWRELFAEQGVRYVERGPNVKRGELNIQCPFCGSADPSHHMGVNLETGWWACWRNSEHRGKSPVRLIARLLNLPYWKARRIAGLDDREIDPDGFDAVAARVMGREGLTKPEHARREFLQFPREFQHLDTSPPRFFYYMSARREFGFNATHDLSEKYGLKCATTGPYRDRVILPYYVDGALVAWTGRAIAPASVRYRDLDRDDCLVPIKETLFNLDCRESGGRVLVVVEGPIDALKVDVFGRDSAVRAVALSTNSLSDQQLYLLEEMAPEFEKVAVIMDNASELGIVDSMKMRARLRTIPNAQIRPVPYGLKDCGEMNPRQARRWAEEISQ